MNQLMQLMAYIMQVIPGFSTRPMVYRMAASMVSFVESDVIGNRLHHLINTFRMLADEFVSQIEIVDYKMSFQKEAYKQAYRWGKQCGYLDDEGNFLLDVIGIPFLDHDLFNRYAQLKRIELAAADKGVNRMFHYMPGIGFVVKSENWVKACYKMRALKVAFAFMNVDVDNDCKEVALFDCTSDRLPVLTETDMELACFDRDDQSFIQRLGRCLNQEGHAFSRVRGDGEMEESTGYDGWAGIQAAHDKCPELRDEIAEVSRSSHRGHVGSIVGLDNSLNRIGFYMQDYNATALLMEEPYLTDNNGEAILDKDGNPKKNFKYWVNKSKVDTMGRQMSWIDKTGDKKRKPGKPLFRSLHSNHVFDPTALKLYANRTVMDPESPLPMQVEVLSDHILERCILDEEKTAQAQEHNKAVFAISKRFQSRSGDFRYVVLWQHGWKTVGLFQVFEVDQWAFCVNSFKAYDKQSRFIGLQIEESATEHGLKSEIFGLMGIKVTAETTINQYGKETAIEIAEQVTTQDKRIYQDALSKVVDDDMLPCM